MKRVFAVILILVIIIGVSIVHARKTLDLTGKIQELAQKVEEDYRLDKWEDVRQGVGAIQKEWEDSHMWAYLTLSTKQIDEIEISLEQSIAYSNIEAKEDFLGEFRMFCMLIDHLPKQETFSLGELL